jgi:hypothetical protein
MRQHGRWARMLLYFGDVPTAASHFRCRLESEVDRGVLGSSSSCDQARHAVLAYLFFNFFFVVGGGSLVRWTHGCARMIA